MRRAHLERHARVLDLCDRNDEFAREMKMSGDTQQPGEKIWAVREVTGHGWSYCVHGHVRFFYALSRKHAKEQFIKAGCKQFESSRVTAVSEGEA